MKSENLVFTFFSVDYNSSQSFNLLFYSTVRDVYHLLGISYKKNILFQLPCETISGKNNAHQSNIITVADEDTETDLGRWRDLEQLHTYTLYYLAQISEKLGEHEDAARYCHATLHRQLADTMVFNILDWCKNAAFLASFYYSRKNYKTGRYLLSSSWAVLTTKALPDADFDQLNEKYAAVRADVAALLGDYCLKMLLDSESLKEMEEDGTSSPPAPSDAASAQWEKKSFDGLNHEVIEKVESELSCELATNFSEASAIFKSGLHFFHLAKSYHTLEEHASRNVEIVQSISKLYHGLTSFEDVPDRRSKMHKRRVDMLSYLLQELNPQYYLQACRQLRFELAETYSKMSSCKVEGSNISEQQKKKALVLTFNSIQQYELFLKSFKTPEGADPDEFPQEAVRAALLAYFHIGRLYSRMKTSDRQVLLGYLTLSVDHFTFIHKYITRNPSSLACFSEEYELCKEMVELLPLKIKRLEMGAPIM